MSKLEIVELVVLGVVIVSLSIYYLIKAIKNKWISQILDTLNSAIKEAETKFTTTGSGEMKKEYVLQKVENKCNELGIPYNLLKTLISTLIDKIIANYNVIKK